MASTTTTTKRIKYTPAPYVIRNIKEMKAMSFSRIRPGMFLHVYYLRKNPNNEKKNVIIQRVVFVLKRLWKGKMHLLDVSEFSQLEWKMFYQIYLQEDNPVRFAEKLWKGVPTVVDEMKRPKFFYHNKIKIPLKRITEVTYRTYISSKLKSIKQVFYKSGTEPPLTEQEIRSVLEGTPGPFGLPPAKQKQYST